MRQTNTHSELLYYITYLTCGPPDFIPSGPYRGTAQVTQVTLSLPPFGYTPLWVYPSMGLSYAYNINIECFDTFKQLINAHPTDDCNIGEKLLP